MQRNCLLVSLVVGSWLTVSLGEDWQPVPEEEGRELRAIAESALATHWDRCQRGWCRATLKHRDDEQDFSFWWDGDRVGMEVDAVRLGQNRDSRYVEPKRRRAVFTPSEQWEYVIDNSVSFGFSGRSAQRLTNEFDIRPRKIWLAMMDDQVPVFRHLNRLQFESSKAKYLRVSRNSEGHIAFDAPELKLVFDPSRGFSPIQIESQSKLAEVVNPEKAMPIRETYDLAQDRHGEWYCRQMTRQLGPRGGKGEPQVFQSALITDYDSRPTAEMLRFSYESLALPKGTRVQSTVPKRPGTWIVGREKEGSRATSEGQLRRLGELLKNRGFATEQHE